MSGPEGAGDPGAIFRRFPGAARQYAASLTYTAADASDPAPRATIVVEGPLAAAYADELNGGSLCLCPIGAACYAVNPGETIREHLELPATFDVSVIADLLGVAEALLHGEFMAFVGPFDLGEIAADALPGLILGEEG